MHQFYNTVKQQNNLCTSDRDILQSTCCSYRNPKPLEQPCLQSSRKLSAPDHMSACASLFLWCQTPKTQVLCYSLKKSNLKLNHIGMYKQIFYTNLLHPSMLFWYTLLSCWCLWNITAVFRTNMLLHEHKPQSRWQPEAPASTCCGNPTCPCSPYSRLTYLLLLCSHKEKKSRKGTRLVSKVTKK